MDNIELTLEKAYEEKEEKIKTIIKALIAVRNDIDESDMELEYKVKYRTLLERMVGEFSKIGCDILMHYPERDALIRYRAEKEVRDEFRKKGITC